MSVLSRDIIVGWVLCLLLSLRGPVESDPIRDYRLPSNLWLVAGRKRDKERYIVPADLILHAVCSFSKAFPIFSPCHVLGRLGLPFGTREASTLIGDFLQTCM